VRNYTKARLAVHIKAPDPYNQQSVEINIDGVAKKQKDVHIPDDAWCRLLTICPSIKQPLSGFTAKLTQAQWLLMGFGL
jgi:hypothetical protein